MLLIEIPCFMRRILLEHKYCMSRAPQMQTTVIIHQCMDFPRLGLIGDSADSRLLVDCSLPHKHLSSIEIRP
jgi:hypothetical protein